MTDGMLNAGEMMAGATPPRRPRARDPIAATVGAPLPHKDNAARPTPAERRS